MSYVVGQRVRIINEDYPYFYKRTGTVIRLEEEELWRGEVNKYYIVKMDSGGEEEDEASGWLAESIEAINPLLEWLEK